jgi:alkylhydroperoxidase/carboxymuconolactone decarboxylase family protein YurZ
LKTLAPEVVAHYEAMTRAAAAAGPLDTAEVALVKLAMSVARGSWRGVHAHARKALEAGVVPDAVRQVALLAVPAIGLQDALDALRWIEEIIEEQTPPAPLQA